MTRLLPRSPLCLPAETNRVVQVKYTNPNNVVCLPHGWQIDCVVHCLVPRTRREKYAFDTGIMATVSYQLLLSRKAQVLLVLDQIKREKGVWWMPWQ